jgi:hypothetical protein
MNLFPAFFFGVVRGFAGTAGQFSAERDNHSSVTFLHIALGAHRISVSSDINMIYIYTAVQLAVLTSGFAAASSMRGAWMPFWRLARMPPHSAKSL